MSKTSGFVPVAEEEWILVGACQGVWLLPGAQHHDYLRAQGWAALIGLMTLAAQVLLTHG